MPTVAVLGQLDDATQGAVRKLAASLAAKFGAPQLNDQALTRLREDHRALRHVVLSSPDVVGYAQVELDGIADAQIAADDPYLRALLDATEQVAPGRDLRIWAHGKHSPVGPALAERGYQEQRVLWQLRRPLSHVVAVPPPPGVAIRPFVPSKDEEAWLAVNAAAFAEHAEQGRWTLHDLQAREAETWFDPGGFLLAERDGDLLGFHWTKIHEPGLGEVYVLGVSPAAQGTGLGPALLAAGLESLVRRGCHTVLLYVDDTNKAALRLYDRAGFHRYDADRQFVLLHAVAHYSPPAA